MNISPITQIKTNASRRSIVIAIILTIIKSIIAFVTGSISILASALDSLLDVFSSTINYFSIRTGMRPSDEEHSFGHGKAESLAGLFQGILILSSCFFLIYRSIIRIILPEPIIHPVSGIITMGISIILTLYLVVRLRNAIKKSDSIALKADYFHYLPDLLTNICVFLGIVVMMFTGWLYLDPILSLCISLYILYSAGVLLKESIDVLMDRQLPNDKRVIVEEVLASFYPRVLSFHALKTRKSGDASFIEMHIEICEQVSFRDAHAITEDVISSIEKRISGAVVTIHTDPCLNCDRCKLLFDSIKGINPISLREELHKNESA